MEKKRKGSSVKVVVIIVMLALCAAAAAYIMKIVRDKSAPEPEPAEDIVTDVEQEPEEDAVPADEVKAKLAHIYTNSGSSSAEKYTMAAFDSAAEGGSVCLAMPVVVSGDGVAYIADDDYLYDMTGLDGYLSGMTEGQIAEVKTKGGSSLVRLSDVFEKYGTDVDYVIEIKYPNERNVMPLVEEIKKAGVADNTSVSSYYFDALERVESEFPDMPKIFLSEEEEDFNVAKGRDVVDTISVDKKMMTEEYLSDARGSGKKFGVWTLNSEEDIRKAVDMGVDSYFTDEGALAVSIEAGE